MKYFTLPESKIPAIGFGTWKMKDKENTIKSIQEALELGYRHFDTAQIYGNEDFLGEALKTSNIPRSEIFITTKIWNDNMSPDKIEASIQESLNKLQTDYIDLLLLHYPVDEYYVSAYKKLQELHQNGQFRNFGVSNYTIEYLQELLDLWWVPPVVNQVELHVFLQEPELVDFCETHNILLEAYSPIAHGQKFGHPIILDLAKRYNKSETQIMLRWCLQKGFVILPKSEKKHRIRENIDLFDFELSQDDMELLKTLSNKERVGWWINT